MPEDPYSAVIFTSLRREFPAYGYGEVAARLEEVVRERLGFLGISISY